MLWQLHHRHPIRQYPRPPYQSRLKEVKLDPAMTMHQMACIMLVFDCFHGTIDSAWLNDQLIVIPRARSTRHIRMLRLQPHRTNFGMNEPVNRFKVFLTRCHISSVLVCLVMSFTPWFCRSYKCNSLDLFICKYTAGPLIQQLENHLAFNSTTIHTSLYDNRMKMYINIQSAD